METHVVSSYISPAYKIFECFNMLAMVTGGYVGRMYGCESVSLRLVWYASQCFANNPIHWRYIWSSYQCNTIWFTPYRDAVWFDSLIQHNLIDVMRCKKMMLCRSEIFPFIRDFVVMSYSWTIWCRTLRQYYHSIARCRVFTKCMIFQGRGIIWKV